MWIVRVATNRAPPPPAGARGPGAIEALLPAVSGTLTCAFSPEGLSAEPAVAPPSLPTVAPTRVPTVHSLPPSLAGISTDQLREMPLGKQRRRVHDDATVIVVDLWSAVKDTGLPPEQRARL